MSTHELVTFFSVWDAEAKKTAALLRALPPDQYDFQPDKGGRSLGQLAWHLAEIDGYTSVGIDTGKFAMGMKVPGIERPRTIGELAPGYERLHAEAVARLRKLTANDLLRTITYFDGSTLPIGTVLWDGLLHHLIHHRGQLSLMCRLAGGAAPGMYGPAREDTERMKEALKARSGSNG